MTDLKSFDFDKVVREHEGIFHKMCRLYAPTREDYDDIYQEILIQVWKSLHSFRGASKLSSYIYRVALNTCLGQVRTSRRWVTESLGDRDFIDEENYLEEDIRNLYRAIRKLPEIDRGLIMLFLEEKSYAEMAEITGISVSNVGVKLNRIRKNLKTIMNGKTG